MLRDGSRPVVRHDVARIGQRDDVVALHFEAEPVRLVRDAAQGVNLDCFWQPNSMSTYVRQPL
jgi:hypothetical protein